MKDAAHQISMLDTVRELFYHELFAQICHSSPKQRGPYSTEACRLPHSALQQDSGYALSVSPHGLGRVVLLVLWPATYIHINLGTKLTSEPAE